LFVVRLPVHISIPQRFKIDPTPDLSAIGNFAITVPTRNPSSPEAQALAKLPNVTLLQANYQSEAGLRSAFSSQESCYFMINTFAIREPDEYFWTFRAYEIAAQSGVKHFIYSGARNRLQESGFDEKYRNSHNVVKAHLSDWMMGQRTGGMGWTIVYGGVYAEMLGSLLCPMKVGEGYVFAAPVHEKSTIPLMPLENYGKTVLWALENPGESVGKFVDAGAVPSTWPEIVSAFTSATGKKAKFQPVSMEQWFEGATKKGIDPEAKMPAGCKDEDEATFTFRKTFGAWWSMWRDNTHENEKPGRVAVPVEDRITSLEEWMRRTDYQGEPHEPTKMRREAAAAARSQS
jgi:hypothetical protein